MMDLVEDLFRRLIFFVYVTLRWVHQKISSIKNLNLRNAWLESVKNQMKAAVTRIHYSNLPHCSKYQHYLVLVP